MIRLPATALLSPSERFALDLLIDLARLVPVDDPGAAVVGVELPERGGEGDLPAVLAAGWGIEPGDGVVRVPRRSLQLVAQLAGAAAEQSARARDRYGRVPSSENALVRAGREREPVVSRAAVTLRDAVVRASAGRSAVHTVEPWPEGRRWAAAVTHDLDIVSWWPAFAAMRIVELTRHGHIAAAVSAKVAAIRALAANPVTAAVGSLLEAERAHQVPGTWFVLCGRPSVGTALAGDLTYHPETRRARDIYRSVAAAGHDFGLHGSFATWQSESEFRGQRAWLERLVQRPVTGVRQHFLRLDPLVTPALMAQAGFRWDSTAGFADRNGFRLGVADVLPHWDVASQRTIALDQAPFVWMDRALSKYRGIEDPDAWVDDALELARSCEQVEGLWVGIWHPNLVPALGFPGAPAALGRLLRSLADRRPWFATLDRIVEWRRKRREARIRTVAPDGRPDLVAAPGIRLMPAAVP